MPRACGESRKRKFGNCHLKSSKNPRLSIAEYSTNDEAHARERSTWKLVCLNEKIGPGIAESSKTGKSQKESVVTGFRFLDMELLVELSEQLNCRPCGCSFFALEDSRRERKGCSSHLRGRYENCGWVYTLYTSKKVRRHSFDVNKRFVYCMKSLGKRHAAAEKFCVLIDMPPPLKPTAYRILWWWGQ